MNLTSQEMKDAYRQEKERRRLDEDQTEEMIPAMGGLDTLPGRLCFPLAREPSKKLLYCMELVILRGLQASKNPQGACAKTTSNEHKRKETPGFTMEAAQRGG